MCIGKPNIRPVPLHRNRFPRQYFVRIFPVFGGGGGARARIRSSYTTHTHTHAYVPAIRLHRYATIVSYLIVHGTHIRAAHTDRFARVTTEHQAHAKTSKTSSETVNGVIDGKWWSSARASGNQPNWN